MGYNDSSAGRGARAGTPTPSFGDASQGRLLRTAPASGMCLLNKGHLSGAGRDSSSVSFPPSSEGFGVWGFFNHLMRLLSDAKREKITVMIRTELDKIFQNAQH